MTGERPPVRHVLLDADGVMQDLPGGWRAALDPFLGERSEELLGALATDEQACLRGEPFLPVLDDLLGRLGVDVPAAELHAAVWERIAVAPGSVALVRELRADGLGVHLATNQNPERAAYMRQALGYGDLFDGAFYSCEMGAAKPEPAYFDAALAALGAAPDEVVLVDDSTRNVDGARAVGLRAEHWHLDHGHDVLRGLLAAHRPG
ncbi:HAD family hydrolase [Nocardioides guangzhouensis]|uniref:HAD family hydrolase n=1 Tax=Nocardioides guangzhouensis TaxID=2497878 RepID=A0A4Q4ZD73_9ACTN|nr:HAD-IA family hydrolase [Nocardioides guangzhouensis]RYP85575.1 HAD family hydrolase [Nocardioides guangzhouensis]